MLLLSQIDDPQKSTYDVPHSNVPVVTAPTSNDGVNQTTQHPTVGCHIIYYVISIKYLYS